MPRPWGRRSSSIWPANAAQLERHTGALFIFSMAPHTSAASGAKSRGSQSMLRVVHRLSRIAHEPLVHARFHRDEQEEAGETFPDPLRPMKFCRQLTLGDG